MDDPRNDFVTRADLLLDVGRPADAAEALEQGLAGEPDVFTRMSALTLLTHARLLLDQPALALGTAEQVVALDPSAATGHRLRSAALSALNRHEDAVTAANAAVRAEPDGWGHHAQYAAVAIRFPRLGQDALAAARHAVQLAPQEADAHALHGAVAEALARPEEADEAYARALALDPTHSHARTSLSEAIGWRLGLGDRLDAYSQALHADPHSSYAKESLERIALVAIRRSYWYAAAALLLCVLAARAGDTLLRIVVGAVLLAAIGVGLGSVWRRATPGVRAFVVERVTADAFLRTSLLLAVLMLVGAAWAAFGSPPDWFLPWAVRPLLLAGVAMVVWDVGRRATD